MILDDKLNVNEVAKPVLESVGYIMGGKEKLMVTSIFSFYTMFTKGFFLKVVKIQHCLVSIPRS